MALDDMNTSRESAESYVSDAADGAASVMAEWEKAASSAIETAETYIRENPITAAVGIGAAGALLAFAIASRRSSAQPLDRRLMNELNRHSADVVRAVRRNANSFANSDTAGALEKFVSDVVGKLAKVPETVAKQASDLAKS